VDHSIFKNGLPLVLDSLNLSQLVFRALPRSRTHFVVNAKHDIDIALVLAFSIVVHFSFTIIEVRVNHLVSRHETRRVRLGLDIGDWLDFILFELK
jgi:hypothetical protein